MTWPKFLVYAFAFQPFPSIANTMHDRLFPQPNLFLILLFMHVILVGVTCGSHTIDGVLTAHISTSDVTVRANKACKYIIRIHVCWSRMSPPNQE